MRGENKPSRSEHGLDHGTSPHAWGKQDPSFIMKPVRRNIPTCVGKTFPASPCICATAEHPHMRGENSPGCAVIDNPPGTSPHAWGKRETRRAEGARGRNIPTCVGKTQSLRRKGAPRSEHPHMRGENLPVIIGVVLILGTSPHAWGKLLQREAEDVRIRNIPTCVGKTERLFNEFKWWAEHPHMRGENIQDPNYPTKDSGTSPHAWGKL